jgi:hypothetical protein
MNDSRSHLSWLEAGSIHIIREVVAAAKNGRSGAARRSFFIKTPHCGDMQQ